MFDDIERTIKGPAPNTASRFAWINECSEGDAEAVRQQVEVMLDKYPNADRDSLIVRLRSDDDSVHLSAFLELTLHEWVLAQGHKILAIEPELPNTEKRPDFLVQTPDGSKYYLEAVARQAEDDRLAGIQDAIDAIDSPVYLNVTIKGQPERTLSAQKIAKKIECFLKQFNPAVEIDAWVPLRWEQDGVRFDVSPLFLKSAKNPDDRTIGLYSTGAHRMSSSGDLEKVLKTKASRYGELPVPYVVATTTDDLTTNLYELTAALFGTTCVAINQGNPGDPGRVIRNANGIWHGQEHQWTNTGLSAVVLIPALNMSNLAVGKPLLMLHPDPRHGFDPDWLDCEVHAIVDGNIQRIKKGPALGEKIGLPEGWPT